MNIELFNYELPEDLIAQTPSPVRGESRLLLGSIPDRKIADDMFLNIPDLIPNDSFLVINNTKVIPARIPANKLSGGKTEIFYLSKIDEYSFNGLIKGTVKEGSPIIVDKIELIPLQKSKDGVWSIKSNSKIRDILDNYGQIPLPPYIKRNPSHDDKNTYQTVFAKKGESIAAPTAGLHFTDEILDRIKKRGIEIAEVTLNVGLGTFRPIKTSSINEHVMHSESFSISEENAHKITELIKMGKKPIAVGTTSVRALESAADENGYVKVVNHLETDIFIKPGYNFKIVKGIITNFHQPKSTLFVLISAFMGLDFAQEFYKHAISEKYRFFSYGDATFIKNW